MARLVELRCRHCAWTEVCGPAEASLWLRRVGKLRPGRAPETAILYALLDSAAAQLSCPRCGQPGLVSGSTLEDQTAWPGEVPCSCCGKPIDSERLAALPGVTRCAACQGKTEAGKPVDSADRCPRCGSPMTIVAQPRGRGVRYVLRCSAQPPCPL